MNINANNRPHPPRVLVIDDDAGTREALVDILSHAGYEVSSLAGTPEDLAALCQSRGCQAAVVDYRLPGTDGLEVARRLKECQPRCRILMISSEMPPFADAAGLNPVDFFLAKPFSRDALLKVMAQLCPPASP